MGPPGFEPGGVASVRRGSSPFSDARSATSGSYEPALGAGTAEQGGSTANAGSKVANAPADLLDIAALANAGGGEGVAVGAFGASHVSYSIPFVALGQPESRCWRP